MACYKESLVSDLYLFHYQPSLIHILVLLVLPFPSIPNFLKFNTSDPPYDIQGVQ